MLEMVGEVGAGECMEVCDGVGGKAREKKRQRERENVCGRRCEGKKPVLLWRVRQDEQRWIGNLEVFLDGDDEHLLPTFCLFQSRGSQDVHFHSGTKCLMIDASNLAAPILRFINHQSLPDRQAHDIVAAIPWETSVVIRVENHREAEIVLRARYREDEQLSLR